ncbi:MAG: hypothetical protein JOZ08_14250 [Verrucomicrobia bacterium]|nr:hypothetical protein [Verrucomicrobiota bacterium]
MNSQEAKNKPRIGTNVREPRPEQKNFNRRWTQINADFDPGSVAAGSYAERDRARKMF